MGIALALACMFCFATNLIISRYAVTRMAVDIGFHVVLTFNILVASVVFLIELGMRAVPLEVNWAGVGYFAISGVLGSWVGRQMMFDTVRYLGPARTSVFHSTTPVLAMVAAWLLLGETLDATELVLMAVVMFGLWFTQAPAGTEASVHRPGKEALRKGFLIGLLTVSSFGLSNGVRGLAMRDWGEPILGTLIACLAAMVLQLATSKSFKATWRGIVGGDRRGLALYAASGVMSVTGAMFLAASMAHMKVALAVLVSHSTPLLIFPLSLILFRNREGLSLRACAGALMVLAGIALLAVI